MWISNASVDQWGNLILCVGQGEAYKFLENFKPAEYSITELKLKRSQSANAYAWALMQQIASVVNETPVEVYRREIALIAGAKTVVTIPSEAYDEFGRAFVKGHLGRSTEHLGEHYNERRQLCCDVLCTYGSSDFDTRQMSQLIEQIHQDCKSLGIQTLDDKKIDAIIADWEKQYAG